MSGPKLTPYELEQIRRRKLAEALEKRKRAYREAVAAHAEMSKKLSMNITVFESKLEAQTKLHSDNKQIEAAYRSLENEIKNVLGFLKRAKSEPIPMLDVWTESESEYCCEAENIKQTTKRFSNQCDDILKRYPDEERRIVKNVEQLKKENAGANALLEKTREACRREIVRKADEIEKMADMVRSVSVMENVAETLKLARKELLDKTDKLLKLKVPPDTEDVNRMRADTGRGVSDIINSINARMEEPLKQIKRFEEHEKEFSKRSAILERMMSSEELSCTLEAIGDMDFNEYEEPDRYAELEKEAREKLDSTLDEIENLVFDDSVGIEDSNQLIEIYEAILKIVRDGQENIHKRQRSLAAKIAEAKTILGGVRFKAEKFERIYCDYVVSCNLLNGIYKSNGEEGKIKKEIDRAEFVSYEELRDENERINAILTKENQDKFVRDSINGVMKKYGYDMAEEFILRRAQKGTHFLCKKRDGDTAIHVYCSEAAKNGGKMRMMFEVVGVGKKAGGEIPDGANAYVTKSAGLTEKRREELLKEQWTFCEIHPEIMKELREMGILIGDTEDNPPDPEFCEEIYIADGKAEKTVTEVEESRGDKRRAKRKNAQKQEMALKMKNNRRM